MTDVNNELEHLLDAHAEVYARATIRFVTGNITEDERDKEFHHSDLKTKKALLKIHHQQLEAKIAEARRQGWNTCAELYGHKGRGR